VNNPNRPTVKLIGEDGNVFYILGKVRAALKSAEYSKDAISEFTKQATSGSDYDTVLQTCMIWVDVE